MILYHSTDQRNVQAILEEGLLISKCSDGFIYFGEDKYTAAAFQFLHNKNVFSIIEFDLPDDEYKIYISDDHNKEFLIKLFPYFKECYYCEEDVTPDCIVSVLDYDGKEKSYR